MMVEIKVPALGESITEASIIQKTDKNVGDLIQIDDLICQLETEKVSVDICAPTSGKLTDLNFSVGDVVKVGQSIGSIDDTVSMEAAIKKEVAMQDRPLLASESVPAVGKKDAPAAVKIMEEKDIEKSSVNATGKGGRITKANVLQHISPTLSQASSAVSAAPASTSSDRGERKVPMSKLRQMIASRLKHSQNTAAILSTFNEINMSAVMAMRKSYKDDFEKRYGVKLGFMSFFVKAVVAALKNIPEINAEISGDSIIYKDYHNVGVAVGTDKGLVVPVIHNAGSLSMYEIERQIAEYGKKAKEGGITASDMSGGTFTISNGGTYGSLLSTPIINPPQSGILGMHSIQQRPVVVDSKIKICSMMYVALSYDHRIVDGKGAVTFLVMVKEALEDPNKLLLCM